MTTIKKKLFGLPLLALFIFGQVELVFHFVLVPHAVCEHGTIVHVDDDSGTPHHDAQDRDNPNHECCSFLLMLTSAKTRLSDISPPEIAIEVLENGDIFLFGEIVALHGQERYFLAPSHSPPLQS